MNYLIENLGSIDKRGVIASKEWIDEKARLIEDYIYPSEEFF